MATAAKKKSRGLLSSVTCAESRWYCNSGCAPRCSSFVYIRVAVRLVVFSVDLNLLARSCPSRARALFAGLRVPQPHHVVAGAGNAHDRAHGVGGQGRAGQVMMKHPGGAGPRLACPLIFASQGRRTAGTQAGRGAPKLVAGKPWFWAPMFRWEGFWFRRDICILFYYHGRVSWVKSYARPPPSLSSPNDGPFACETGSAGLWSRSGRRSTTSRRAESRWSKGTGWFSILGGRCRQIHCQAKAGDCTI